MRARCSVVILVIAAPPACHLCERRRDLAQQHLDDRRELALLSWRQFDARSLGLEQVWLEILGSVRHSLVAPFLIRTPESLEAHRPRCVGSKEHPGENAARRRSRIGTQPRPSSTPKAGKGAVKLVHNEKRGAASLEPPPNAHDLAKAGVKSVGDACLRLLFAGSMSPFPDRPAAPRYRAPCWPARSRKRASACADVPLKSRPAEAASVGDQELVDRKIAARLNLRLREGSRCA